MSDTSRTVKVKFDGSTTGLSAAARKAERDLARLARQAEKDAARLQAAAVKQAEASLDRVQSAARGFGTGLVAAGAAGGLLAAGVGAAIPALGSLALGFGVAKLAMSANNKESEAYKKKLESLKKPLQDLQNTAGKAFLPGVTQFLEDSKTLFPILDRNVARTGKIMGDTARDLGELFKTERFQQNLDGFLKATEPVTRQIGDTIVRLTDRLIQFGAEMAPAAEGFASFLDGLTSGVEGFLDGLAPHADDIKSIFESLGSILESVLPLVGQLAGAFAERLAPILRDVAGFLRDNKGAISEWIPAIADLAVAIGALVVANKIKGWVDTGLSALDALGLKADTAGKKLGPGTGLAGRLGLLKGAAAAAGLALVAVELDKVNTAAAGGEQNLQGFEENLHDVVGAAGQLASGDFGGIFTDISAEIDTMVMKFKTAQSPIGEFFHWLTGQKPDPIPVDVDTAPGEGRTTEFVGGISRRRGFVQVDGDINAATGKITQVVTLADGSKGTMTVDGNPDPATGKISGTVRLANGSRGTVTIDGNQTPANGKVNAAVTYANGRRGTIQVDANTAAANSRIAGLVSNWQGRRINLIVTATGSGGIASAGRLAAGGPVAGPGSGTSDTAGLFALSNGEHVFTAKEVQNAGGHGAIERLRAALASGRPAGLASGGPVKWDRPSSTAAAALRGAHPGIGPEGLGNGPMRSARLVVAPGADSAVAALIMNLIRTNKIQLKAA